MKFKFHKDNLPTQIDHLLDVNSDIIIGSNGLKSIYSQQTLLVHVLSFDTKDLIKSNSRSPDAQVPYTRYKLNDSSD